MKTQPSIVAIDAGRSAVKVVVSTPTSTQRFLFPSVVMRATELSDEIEASGATRDTIFFGANNYWVGNTAQIQRSPGAGIELSDNWITTEEHRVLLLSALQRAEAFLAPKAEKLIVLGLPGRQFKQQRAVLAKIAQELFADEVKIIPQPKCPYHRFLQQPNGQLASGRSLQESWAVIDVGRFTTDIAVIVEGHFIEQGLDSCDGTKGAAEVMLSILNDKGVKSTITDAEKALQRRALNYRGNHLDLGREAQLATKSLVNQIMATITRVIEPYSTTLHGLILAGGGAPLVAQTLSSQWGNIVTATGDDARFMVAEGMARWAAGILLARRAAIGGGVAV